MLKLPVEELLCVTMTTRLLGRWNGVKNRNQMFSCVKIISVLVTRLAREFNQSRGWRGFSSRLIFSQHGQQHCCCFSSSVLYDIDRVLDPWCLSDDWPERFSQPFCISGVTDYLSAEISTSKQKKFSLVTFVDTPGLVDGDMVYPFDVNSAITWLGMSLQL